MQFVNACTASLVTCCELSFTPTYHAMWRKRIKWLTVLLPTCHHSSYLANFTLYPCILAWHAPSFSYYCRQQPTLSAIIAKLLLMKTTATKTSAADSKTTNCVMRCWSLFTILQALKSVTLVLLLFNKSISSALSQFFAPMIFTNAVERPCTCHATYRWTLTTDWQTDPLAEQNNQSQRQIQATEINYLAHLYQQQGILSIELDKHLSS
jgi:hypothetical protein